MNEPCDGSIRSKRGIQEHVNLPESYTAQRMISSPMTQRMISSPMEIRALKSDAFY
jgi:hypothetical protein